MIRTMKASLLLVLYLAADHSLALSSRQCTVGQLAGDRLMIGKYTVEELIDISKAKIKRVDDRQTPATFPHATECADYSSSRCHNYNEVEPRRWVGGFLPGLFMQFYDWDISRCDLEDADAWLERFDKRIGDLSEEPTREGTHDVGFKVFYSYGHGYISTGNEDWYEPIVQGAHTLALRYSDTVGAIKSWDTENYRYPTNQFKWPVIIDNMMNLEMMLWVSEKTGNQTLWDMAVQHSKTTIRDLYRSDSCTWHVANYDGDNGELLGQYSQPQGLNMTSIWTRGVAFGIHGFTTVYKWTKEEEFLSQAIKTADCFISELEKCCENDYVPLFDFQDTEKRPDTSAGAIAASGFIELSTFVEAEQSVKYVLAADRILKGLAGSKYMGDEDMDSILVHGMGDFPVKDIDVGLIYGDYFFVEALTRFAALEGDR
ncbi:hypothetical protein SARC_08594 [Sphaeroforma arctica JP610]|uniref:Glycosyl hydrolase family 88 n=1 Tax=Sphaeroforma arctica JP610 TaxID=667725 RepID=A0A0L0FSQ4_9EUKA|nr:hypothetical protein SARC_08594 [Sphaeroforma arctica JP610]KNC78993.1 hypothetical protein SARC_08594 [Sphaeroforma arctica JP610]|eukprot:XP_014152895.1 hypothetical protein SARC_08594 [Sphaeroforma arctica JP610]